MVVSVRPGVFVGQNLRMVQKKIGVLPPLFKTAG